ncbi:putative Fructokinase [Pseudooceanicola batsensis HTCC2597]|uniref:Putative Fructokinase n=1 Tax=Pseudooceanicola batsensis (strain ATCC BAA-863 / DSM 15984 / KCTC 12145 / HTCC2597) TaxID=252305 RepID=A3TT67_PSEBH|nr:carbohydrate kinase [Pseudooceanicola batsensis]EAQ04844.1 putative Fructokinase [Pseudooceanicola batsensis HTCC2597]
MILCCGEALIDMIPAPTDAGREGFVPHSGGAVFNTAIALGRLGVPAGMLTGLSTDMFGAQLMGDLAASRVDTGHVIRSDRPSTLAFVRLTGGKADYSFFDENSAGRMLTPDAMPDPAPGVRAMFFGGISLACEPAAGGYADLATRRAGDRVVMIDPNIRPGFIADPARYRARLEAMIAAADIVKLSDEDLDWLDPGPEPAAERIGGLLRRGPALAIMTRGRAGAVAVRSDGTKIEVQGRDVTVVDTVGAGDTFNAGLLASLDGQGLLTKAALRSLPEGALRAALSFAAEVAGVTVSRAGADPPWAHEVGGGGRSPD